MASGSTATYGIPYPVQTDAVDVAADVKLLADQVEAKLLEKAPISSPIFTGTAQLSQTPSLSDNSTQLATTAFVIGQGYLKSSAASSTYAPIASPNFTGTPQINSISIATTTSVTSSIATHASASSSVHGVVGALVGTTDSQTLTNKIISSATLNGTLTSTATVSGGDLFKNRIISPKEKWNISSTAVVASQTINYLVSQNWYYTTASTAGACTVNIIGDGTNSLSSLIGVGDSITFSFAVTTGATTPAYFNAVNIDGTATGVTIRWQYGTTPTSGTTSGVDVYSFTVLKTGTGTYTVFASVSKW